MDDGTTMRTVGAEQRRWSADMDILGGYVIVMLIVFLSSFWALCSAVAVYTTKRLMVNNGFRKKAIPKLIEYD